MFVEHLGITYLLRDGIPYIPKNTPSDWVESPYRIPSRTEYEWTGWVYIDGVTPYITKAEEIVEQHQGEIIKLDYSKLLRIPIEELPLVILRHPNIRYTIVP